ncbi:exocyst complex component 3-like isoform X2 [Acanthaster planci]|uniref:Exocyst complex component 3-like isoform X2 n=1 Tax=Acanthaster planci TaxID=133434 RepID=A0A8B7YA09_ACAPL|nr:exocyst complex component 3-like isoform X2 [Acanthaster planci]
MHRMYPRITMYVNEECMLCAQRTPTVIIYSIILLIHEGDCLQLNQLGRCHKKKPSLTITMERRPSANQSDNLWRNYKKLEYLETCRGEILDGVHRELTKIDETDTETKIRSESFQGVKNESNFMFEQIHQVFLRLQSLATYDQHLLHTCVKIVDSEERKDYKFTENSTENDGSFLNSERPKRWREKCLEVMKTGVSKRASETAPSPEILEDKDGSRLLLRLTKARDDIQKDLEHARSLSKVFTEEWDMLNTYMMTYYENLMTLMYDRFSFHLNDAETVQVLSWMIWCRDRIFNCQDANCKPCRMIVELQDKFLREKKGHIHEWMENALERDINDWRSEDEPIAEHSGAFYTQFPLDILKMLEENLRQARDISWELHEQISMLSLQELDAIMESYAASAKAYIGQEPALTGKTAHRHSPKLQLQRGARKNSDEPRPTHFEKYAVALLNNFDKIALRLKEMMEISKAQKQATENCRNNNNMQMDEDPTQTLIRKINAQTKKCSELLLPKLLGDINTELNTLLTQNWLAGNGREAVDTMCDVMTSYLRHLREPVRALLMSVIEEKLVVGYLEGLIKKRIRFEGRKSDRLALFDKICRECSRLEKFLQDFGAVNGNESRWAVVRDLAGLVQVDDQQTAITDLIVLVNKYPDLKEKHARRVLKVRGDFSKAQIKSIISQSLGKKRGSVKGEKKRTIFSELSLA